MSVLGKQRQEDCDSWTTWSSRPTCIVISWDTVSRERREYLTGDSGDARVLWKRELLCSYSWEHTCMQVKVEVDGIGLSRSWSALFFEPRPLTEPAPHELTGLADWIRSPMGPPASVSLVLGLQAHAALSGFSCGCWGWKLRAHAWTASTLSTEPSP